MFSKILFWLILLLLFTGCVPAAAPTPYTTPTIWQISRTPSLSWLDQSFNLCIQQQNEFRVIVHERPLAAVPLSDYDIALVWGEPDDSQGFAYTLGSEELVFIIHPDNPLQEISLDTLRNIYSQQGVYWPDSKESIVTSWKYPENNEAQLLLEVILGSTVKIGEHVSTTPDVEGMLSQVSQDSNAIGFVPENRLQSNTKPIRISGLPPENLTFPVVALLKAQPDQFQTAWLTCLQERITVQ